MVNMNDRERAFESKYAHDQETKFRIVARRNKLLGQWAGGLLGKSDVDAYAREVIAADFEEAGDEDVVRKVLGDLTAAGIDTCDDEIRQALQQNASEAKRQLIEAQGPGA